MVDIAIGFATKNPLVIIDVIGLIVTIIADIVNWDSAWGREPPIDYNFEESTLYLNYN